MRDTKDDATGVKSEMSRKLRYLEQEDLQLMLDVKILKKQLSVAREELEMLRMNAVQNPTLDFGTVNLGTSGMIEMAKSENGNTTASATSKYGQGKRARNAEESRQKKVSTPVKKDLFGGNNALAERANILNKENNSTPGRKRQRVTRQTAPGLGEAAVQDGDNTGECKQS
jgi:hypothetical protein